ncbi:hypothetical protein K2173_021479 [Erythroxylum novogranatense]|uniref:DUF7081 domain-containing protein n=1 Tax=Erythroxylum novogranatense TaxID=1862640 RepID=A0AAV8TN18_9ROSI|nr:hypothetical protein K2173_021479 [Erythroxylum novogranatense]
MSNDSDPFPHLWDQVQVHAGDVGHADAQGHADDVEFKTENPKEIEEPEDHRPISWSTPTTVSSQQNEQVDFHNHHNGGTVEDDNILWPVLPGESGEGLPYAPSNWPAPGDNWTWRVGRRFSGTGYFQDRFLTPPKRLRKTPGWKQFASKPSIENFIRSTFPDADVQAFFASFTWKIPVKAVTPAKVQLDSVSFETPPPPEKEKVDEMKEDVRRSSRPRRKPPQNVTLGIEEDGGEVPHSGRKKRKPNATGSSSTPKQRTRRSYKKSVPYSAVGSEGDKQDPTPQELALDLIPEDFDNYLNSLDDIITQPVDESVGPTYAAVDSHPNLDDMVEARIKLSSLLVMDFPSLIVSRNISELTSLASKLRKDPYLSAEQLVKLKLIEDMPMFSEVYMESREMIDQVDKCFAILDANKTKVTSLKSEYNELKDKADQLQSQVDSSLLTVKEIDNQIAQLQSWRAELIGKIETDKESKMKLNAAQRVVASEIPGLVQEIQLANGKVPEWVLKKRNAENREAEVLAKYSPLKGFSL